MSIYALSDLHGYYDLYKQIKKFLKPEDKVIFLGDACDRGPQSWKLLKAVLKDEQFICIRGNHEDLLSWAMLEFAGEPLDMCPYEAPLIDSVKNGGDVTLGSWYKDGQDVTWSKLLRKLPDELVYENTAGKTCICSHAGYTPTKDPDAIDILWNREHIADPWPQGYDNTVMVFGHTPCCLIEPGWKTHEGAVWLRGRHKVCIDMATYATGCALLFDLDTFEEHFFYTEISN